MLLATAPYKGSLPTAVPTDPLIYRFYEMVRPAARGPPSSHSVRLLIVPGYTFVAPSALLRHLMPPDII